MRRLLQICRLKFPLWAPFWGPAAYGISNVNESTAKVCYRSTNPKNRGEGYAKVKFVDLGEGNEDHGWFEIDVLTGPFSGYENEG
jgi:hypothetical protein